MEIKFRAKNKIARNLFQSLVGSVEMLYSAQVMKENFLKFQSLVGSVEIPYVFSLFQFFAQISISGR